jgi:hypothetical protein
MREEFNRGTSSLLQLLNQKLESLKQLNNMNNILQSQLTEIKSIIRSSADITSLEAQVDATKSNLDTLITQGGTSQASLDALNTDTDAILVALATIESAIPTGMNTYLDVSLTSASGTNHVFTPDKDIEIYGIDLTLGTSHKLDQIYVGTMKLFWTGCTTASNTHVINCYDSAFDGTYHKYVLNPIQVPSGVDLKIVFDFSSTISSMKLLYKCNGAAATFS